MHNTFEIAGGSIAGRDHRHSLINAQDAFFKQMGIKDEWILTPKNSKSEIRKAFVVFSQSAVSASQSAASFSKTALGGLG